MEDKSQQKQELEKWTPPEELIQTYEDLEMEVIKNGDPLDKVLVYTTKYPVVIVLWTFIVMVVLALCQVKPPAIFIGVLTLGSFSYLGSMLRRWKNGR